MTPSASILTGREVSPRTQKLAHAKLLSSSCLEDELNGVMGQNYTGQTDRHISRTSLNKPVEQILVGYFVSFCFYY